jgi:hypothetical protein
MPESARLDVEDSDALVRAKRAYERSRAKSALVVALPLGILALCTMFCGTRDVVACGVGLALLIGTWYFGWQGRTFGRAVLPGVVAGVIPFGLALAARAVGHVCTPEGCVSLCVPACTVGGAIAGLLVARAGRTLQGSAHAMFMASGGALALLVGSLGCSCVGYGGLAGLLGGLIVGGLPSVFAFAFARRAR